MRKCLILLILLLLPALSAVPVKMVAPLTQEISEGDVVFIGTIGPGQTLDVQIDPIVTTGGIYGQGGRYDLADASSLPTGWSSEPSELLQDPLQVKISAHDAAPVGLYLVNITVVDENNGHKLGNLTFTAKINITWDILDVEVNPSHVTVGPNQPAQYEITVKNKGSASDTYTVSASGAKQWEFTKPIYIPAKSSRTIFYEMAAEEEEYYQPTISVVSASSANIYTEKNVTFSVRSGLIGDYNATNNGVILFPVFETPIYSFAGFVAALLGSLGF